MQRFAVACVLLFLGGSVSMADNFTPIINRSSQPMASTPKARLAEEQTKCWCMGSRPPPICTLVTLSNVRSSLRRVVRLRALVVALPIMGRRFAPPISATLHDDPMSFAGGAPMGRELKTCELRA